MPNGINPFLQLLLGKRQRQPWDELIPGISAPADTSPDQPAYIRQPIATDTTQPVAAPRPIGTYDIPGIQGRPVLPQEPTAPDTTGTTIPLGTRNRNLEQAADVVRNYQRGLHQDPDTGEWVPYHRSKFKQIGEGLLTFAAGGIGLPLQ